MKISLDWLSDYIETGLSAERIAGILSDLGLPCEGIERFDADMVIDVEVTSNRGDCLGLIGIARELAAATGNELKLPAVEINESQNDVDKLASVRIEEPDLCGRYTARIIEGVKVGPSPQRMVRRLKAAGMRSVNNVVDATNYAMFETGQPPHAFDYDKITEGKIIVRRAAAGERLVSIDGSRCELDPDMLIIADAKGPVAIAGVMGGLDSEVGSTTATILLEDAYFDPVSVRATSRRLALPSEAAFRFERIVDIERIDWASKRTAQLITQAAGGRVAKGVIDVYPKKYVRKQVTLRPARLKLLLGVEIPLERVLKILSALRFEPARKEDLVVCSVPSWRSDVYREADLIEEVARVYGYDRIPTEQKIRIEVTPPDPRQKLLVSVGAFLNACGFYETINVTFVDADTSRLFAGDRLHLAVADESRKSANLLRQSLIPSLLAVLKTNLNAGNTPCRIFEIADTFITADKAALPIEKSTLGLVCDSDLRDLRGVVEALIKRLARDAAVDFVPADLLWAQGGAEIRINGRAAGTAGIISRQIRERFDLEDVPAAAAELDFEYLLALHAGPVKAKPIPRFPAIVRDLSVVVDEQVPWSQIHSAVSENPPQELEDIRFVDIYRGKGVPAGKKSVTLSLRFRDQDGTLTHEQVDEFEKAIIASLAKSTGGQLRSA